MEIFIIINRAELEPKSIIAMRSLIFYHHYIYLSIVADWKYICKQRSYEKNCLIELFWCIMYEISVI